MKRQFEEPGERQAQKNPKLAAKRLAESMGFDDKGTVVRTTGFDELTAELAQLGIDAAAFHAAKPKKQLAMLRKAGVSKHEAAELIGNYRERHRIPTGNPHQQQQRIEQWLRRKPEAEKWLRNVKGLPPFQCALVLACVFDGSDGKRPSLRRLESSTGRKRQWISNNLKQSTIKDCIAELQSALASDNPLQLPESPAVPDRPGGMWLTVPLSSAPRRGLDLNLLVEGVEECRVGGTLSEKDDSRELKRTLASIESRQRPCFTRLADLAMALAQASVGANPNDTAGAAGFEAIGPYRGKEIAEAIITCVRKHPAVLLQPEGRILLEGLVDLLEAARFGCSKGRVRGLLPSGKPKELQRFAQTLLVELTKAEHGAKRSRPEGYL
ncbi:MAG TPA: hypothetical protein VMV72_01100 [Verrucomicrobiae bacterium]|nr:hypothetical protein [Verrucomicrobiae bacterium]